jgi:hypothetical protein
MDPLKFKSILSLPPPNNLTQMQSFQGKEKRFHHFICNYIKITKGFMRLLQKDSPLIWDATTQHSFDAIKHDLTITPIFHPPNYEKDYILYLDSSTSTISMVLVKEDDDDIKHVI